MNPTPVNKAILMDLAQPPELIAAMRDKFEAAAYAHYLERWDGNEENGHMTQEQFCRRNEDDRYFYKDLQQAWWGFQAGFNAACIAGANA